MASSAKISVALVRFATALVACAAGCTSFGSSEDPVPAVDAAVAPTSDASAPPVPDATADGSVVATDAADAGPCLLHETIDFSTQGSFDSPKWVRAEPQPSRLRIELVPAASNVRGYTIDAPQTDDYAVAAHHVPYGASVTRVSFDVGEIVANDDASFVIAQVLGVIGERKNVSVVWRAGNLEFFVSSVGAPFASVRVATKATIRVRLDLDARGEKIAAFVDGTLGGSASGVLATTPAPKDVDAGPGTTLQLGLYFPLPPPTRTIPTQAVYDNVRVEHCN